ncbi:MAG: hypothetical protein K9N52_01855 [Verrucomicrobia bacterium]|nr:hypothetical protein [Verrucomicrobiota bacterium]
MAGLLQGFFGLGNNFLRVGKRGHKEWPLFAAVAGMFWEGFGVMQHFQR